MKTHRFNSNQASPAKPRPASAMARVQVSLTWRGESFSIGKLEPADWLTVWKSIIAARVDSAKQTAADFDWLPYEIGGKAVESAAKRIHDTEPSPTEAATWIAVNASEIVYPGGRSPLSRASYTGRSDGPVLSTVASRDPNGRWARDRAMIPATALPAARRRSQTSSDPTPICHACTN